MAQAPVPPSPAIRWCARSPSPAARPRRGMWCAAVRRTSPNCRWNWAANRRTSSSPTPTSTARSTAPSPGSTPPPGRAASPVRACWCRMKSTTSSSAVWWNAHSAFASATPRKTAAKWARWPPRSNWPWSKAWWPMPSPKVRACAWAASVRRIWATAGSTSRRCSSATATR
ncbi:hypothetical protein D3C75_885020 [compost metagenome]